MFAFKICAFKALPCKSRRFCSQCFGMYLSVSFQSTSLACLYHVYIVAALSRVEIALSTYFQIKYIVDLTEMNVLFKIESRKKVSISETEILFIIIKFLTSSKMSKTLLIKQKSLNFDFISHISSLQTHSCHNFFYIVLILIKCILK